MRSLRSTISTVGSAAGSAGRAIHCSPSNCCSARRGRPAGQEEQVEPVVAVARAKRRQPLQFQGLEHRVPRLRIGIGKFAEHRLSLRPASTKRTQ